MRDQLLGYLVGALEPEEAELVELQLRIDPELHDEVERLRAQLALLGADQGHHEPPLGLAQRTCSYVSQRCLVDRLQPCPGGQRWVMQDLLVAAGIMIAASMFFFPAVNYSRYQAQVAGCQNSLRQIVTAMRNYSWSSGGYFPSAQTTAAVASPMAFAPILVEAGYLGDPRVLMCPAEAATRKAPCNLPSATVLAHASPAEKPRLERAVAGDYRSTIGYTEKNEYHPPRNLGRTYYALVADSPNPLGNLHQSTNHGGRGQNVGFEDGHVEFLKTCRCRPHGKGVPEAYSDDIYANSSGIVGLGNGRDDSVIASEPVRLSAPIVPVGLER